MNIRRTIKKTISSCNKNNIKLNIILRIIQTSVLIILYQNCYTEKTYVKAFPYPKSERVSFEEIENISIDTNDNIKVNIKEHSGCLKIGDGSYFIHFRKRIPNQKCGSFDIDNSQQGTLTFKNISNSAILRNDKIIIDLSAFPQDKFKQVNPYVVWSASKGFNGYSDDPKVDSTFKNAYISNDYKYLFIEKKEKMFVFNTHEEKNVIRRIVIENLANKIINSYKNKKIPIQFVRIEKQGILSITEYRTRLFYELSNTHKLYDVKLDLSKDKEQEPNYRYIPLIPISLIADIIISPVVIPVITYYYIAFRYK